VEILIARRAVTGAFAVALLAMQPGALSADGLEYQVKAAFLFNFLKFVEWPPAPAGAPWVIGVLGHDPFGEMLDETVRGKIVSGRSIEVRRYSKLSDAKDCSILFIGRGEYLRTGIPAMQPGLLTVGEAPGFLKSGGAISFYLEDNRVRFEIRPEAARAAGLRMSAQLLKLGRAL